jgi:beta-xylosidase
MRTTGSTKVVHDRDGNPWLVVGTADGYEAHRLQVTERHLFDRSWQAVQFAGDFKAVA